MLSKQPVTLFLDEGAYAIARWGTERAAVGGVAAHRFRHHDPQALLSQITVRARWNKCPVVIADGYCPACGGPAPIGDYLDIVRRFGGLLVLDDTQSLGVLARHRPGSMHLMVTAVAVFYAGAGSTARTFCWARQWPRDSAYRWRRLLAASAWSGALQLKAIRECIAVHPRLPLFKPPRMRWR